jgi:hypothetical protein
MNREKNREQGFIDDVERTLRQKGEKLPPDIVVQLSAIRSVALQSRGYAFAGFWRMARLPVAAAMVAVALFVMATRTRAPCC